MNDCITYLLNYAFDHGIGYSLRKDIPSTFPSFSNCSQRHIYINEMWYRPKEIPFQIGHEIGYIMNGDEGILYCAPGSFRNKYEHAANVFSMKLLQRYANDIDITYNSSVQFCQIFGVPSEVVETINEEFGEYKCRAK